MIIVTHKNPDPDAVCAVWLLKRYHPDFEEAEIRFISAGSTYQDKKVDGDSEIVHVDTGFGRFDHHQYKERTCAARKVLDFLKDNQKVVDIPPDEKKVLEKLVEIIIQDDHFEDCIWPEANNNRYSFWLTPILDGLKRGGLLNDQGLIEFGLKCLDGILTSLKLKLEAEKEIEESGVEFESPWGPGLGIESRNDEVIKVGQKQGRALVVRKDPSGMVRIKVRPDSGADLTKIYQVLNQKDPKATWFLHQSKKMLLNGSYRNPEMVPSKLSLKEVIEAVKKGG